MKSFIPALIWAVVIFFLSTTAGINLPETWLDFLSWDKIGHFTVYGILTFLLLFGFCKKNKKRNKQFTVLAVLGSSLYGILLEWVQYSFFPMRYFENLDILANIIGSFIGLLLFKYFKPCRYVPII